jgi:hypothetical protein
MPIAAILQTLAFVSKYGPDAVDYGRKIVALIRNTHPDLTAADIVLLDSFATKTAEDYLREVGGAP